MPVGTHQPSPVRDRSTVWAEPLLKITLAELAPGTTNKYQLLPSAVMDCPGQVFSWGEPLEFQK